MVVEHFPHVCIINRGNSPDVYDPVSGGWTIGSRITLEIRCRAYPNGSGKKIQSVDNVNVDYNFDLSFPLGSEELHAGEEVTIMNKDVTLVTGRLLRFQTGQLHNRGWI